MSYSSYETKKEIIVPNEIQNTGFAKLISETRDYFANTHGVDVCTESGYADAMRNPKLKSEYETRMFGDVATVDANVHAAMIMNHNNSIEDVEELGGRGEIALKAVMLGDMSLESNVSGNISAFSALNAGVIKGVYGKSALPELTVLDPLQVPYKDFTYKIPYMQAADGTKVNPAYGNSKGFGLKSITLDTSGSDVDADACITANDFNIFDLSVGLGKGQFYAIDASSELVGIKTDDSGTIEIQDVRVRGVEKLNGATQIHEFTAQVQVGAETATVIITLGYKSGDGTWMTNKPALVKGIKMDLKTTSENNKSSWTVGNEDYTLNFEVPMGEHYMIDTPVELVKDFKKNNPQGWVAYATSLVTHHFAQQINIQGIDMIDKSYASGGSVSGKIPNEILRSQNVAAFDFHANLVSHADDPTKLASTMLRKAMSKTAAGIQEYTRLEDGYWTVMGDKTSMLELPDFEATVSKSMGGSNEEKYGFKNYSTFAMSVLGMQRAKCASLPELSEGDHAKTLISFFNSTDPQRPTYRFHPYCILTGKGYNNPNNPNVPSIMITRRVMFQDYLPMQYRVGIEGSSGQEIANFMTPKQKV